MRILVCLLMLICATAAAAPRDYAIDPVHSRVVFSVDHAGFSHALGTFSAPRGWIHVDRAGWKGARVEVELDLQSLDLGDANWNQRIAKRDFLDLARYPLARFRSREVVAIDPANAQVIGELQLRDRSLPITLAVRRGRAGRHPLSLRQTVGFSATATLSRSAFGISAWKSLVGDEVVLRIEVEAQRRRRPH